MKNGETVYVSKYEKTKEPGKYHMDIVPDGHATFQAWGVDHEEFETNAGNFSIAIIERDDGSIETVVPTMIKLSPHDSLTLSQ